MKVVMFGASGMVGQGVLRECLLDAEVERVVSFVRSPTGRTDDKLREIVLRDFTDYSAVAGELAGFDACFFCLGVSSAGMSETDYARITYDMTLAAAHALVQASPGMTFIYVSGAGTDGSERGRSMWARVKGRTENALLKLPFKATYMFRPGMIRPMHGVVSRTRLYRVLYATMGWLYPMFKLLFPKWTTTSEVMGRAMLVAARRGAPKPVLETADINALAGAK
jgi:uncharacterized protein YbjT (DUF2867 family)